MLRRPVAHEPRLVAVCAPRVAIHEDTALAGYGSSGSGSSASQAGTFSSAWESMIAAQVSSSTGSAGIRLLVTGTTIRSDRGYWYLIFRALDRKVTRKGWCSTN